ncbi:hypothetical protein EKH79_11250 [Dyella dinghuensis]|uniref:Uncharacterized protein n=1 Tax=Dyella dinghuensis TaxID=1920169 RepID=A0A432LR15_9GAMM|nr:hypothetical protein [Dyella dinghuensis]RUL62989.1 hypothetical protein EKH79_11250 [Dyella dinghuensis]
MSLNFREVSGALEIGGDDRPGDENYMIFPDHPAFDGFMHICMCVCAMSLAISKLRDANVKEGDYVGLSCKGLDYTIRIPVFGPVHLALERRSPTYAHIAIHWGRNPIAQSIWSDQHRQWLQRSIWPVFVELFESSPPGWKKCSDGLWPLAKVLRNSYSHGGKIAWDRGKDGAVVEWGGVRISRDHDRNKPVGDFVGDADLIIMMLAMFDGKI